MLPFNLGSANVQNRVSRINDTGVIVCKPEKFLKLCDYSE